MLRKRKISRFLSLAVIIALVFMSIPGEEVWAAEDGRDSFVITSFEEQDNWPLKTVAFPVGTSVGDMKFPSEWKISGYQKTDPDKTVTDRKLTQLVWSGTLADDEEQKTENGTKEEKLYDPPKSGAGIYLFRLKLPEGFETEASVKLPEQKINIGTEAWNMPGTDKTGTETTGTGTTNPELDNTNTTNLKPDNTNTTNPGTTGAGATNPEPGNTNTTNSEPDNTNTTNLKPDGTNTTNLEPGNTNTTNSEPDNTNTTNPDGVNTTNAETGGINQTGIKPGNQIILQQQGEAVTLNVDDLPERMAVGNQYQIRAEAQAAGTTPPPPIAYNAVKGADVISVDGNGLVQVLTEGEFTVDVSCGTGNKQLTGRTVLPDTDSKIHSFSIGDWTGVIKEDPQGSLIEVTAPYGTDLTGLAASLVIGTYAKSSPASGEVQNFTDPVIYTVTAEDGSQTVYTVKVQAVCTEHRWLPATCTEPEICEMCGVKGADATGHQWKEATCTEPAVCTVCGTKKGEAAGHQWEAADCTHAETCSRCGQTRGTPLGHSWGEWTVKKQPTTKEKGLEERKCSRCRLTQTREIPRLNIIGKAENNQIKGIKSKGIYQVNEKITITGLGDGMENQEPIANDVRYVPSGWHVTSYNAWTKAPYQSTFTVRVAGNYQLQVYFQKQTFDGKNWMNEEETDTKTVDFTISADKAVPVQTGDEAPLGAAAAAMGLAVLVMIILSFRKL